MLTAQRRRRAIALCVLGVVFSFYSTTRAQQATPDFSGVDHFWTIADSLQQGREPDTAQWDALFAASGYAALEAREKRRAALQQGIRLAFNPSLVSERDIVLAGTTWTARVIRHVQKIPGQRAALERFRTQLVRDAFLARAIERAQTLLPAGATARLGTPRVSFIFFLPDGRGYPDIIVADLANIAGRTDVVPFFAHEVTHFYYAHLARERGSVPVTPFETVRLTLLTKLFEESLGDQHDKAPFADATAAEFERMPLDEDRRAYFRDYRARYAEATTLANDLARALASGDAKTVETLGRQLPLEGRPLGFHMTRVIRRKLGDERLKALVGDPLAWYAAFAG